MEQVQPHNGKTAGVIGLAAGAISAAGPLIPFGFLALPLAIVGSIIAFRKEHKKLAVIGFGLIGLALILWLIIIITIIIMAHEPND